MENIKTKKELISLLKGLGEISTKTKKDIICSLIGHSNIQEMCLGYVSCARCGQQVGDALAGVYENKKQVVVGHNCEICQENYKQLTWRDKYLCPNPFKKI